MVEAIEAAARTARQPAGPRGLPLLGVAHALRRDPLAYVLGLRACYGAAVRFRIGGNPILLLSDPEAIRHVLQDNHRNYHKSRFYRAFAPLLGGGIFMSEGETWLRQRRTANPYFAGIRFERMAAEIAGAADDMLRRWDRAGREDRGVAIVPEMMRVTLDGLTRAMFSLQLAGEHEVLHDALTIILRRTERRVWALLPQPEWLAIRTDRRYRRALATTDRLVWRLIRDRRREPSPPDDLLSALIAASDPRDPRSERILRDQIVSMIAAGHESTACALAWAFCMLARHPDVERRLHAEADAALGGRPPGFSDLGRLPFARMVLEETMRLYPPVWTISRLALADDVAAGVPVPKGTTVMLSPYVVHRDPGLWPDPERFDPERFAPGADRLRHRLAYFPFGGGPRVCLGNRFAIMEGQIILAMVAQRYRLTLAPDAGLVPEPMITLRPQAGLRLGLVPRGARHHERSEAGANSA